MKQWTESKKEMLFLDVFGMSLPAWWHIAIVVDRHPAWILLVHIQLFPAIDLIWSDPRTQKLTAEEVLSLSSWRWRQRRPQKLSFILSYSSGFEVIPVNAHVRSYMRGPFITFGAHVTIHANKQTNERTDKLTYRLMASAYFQHHSMDSPPRRWEWHWKWTIFLHLSGKL